MSLMLELSEAAANTEYLPLSKAVEGKYIIMLHTPQLIIATLK